jgi:hypothetical protein
VGYGVRFANAFDSCGADCMVALEVIGCDVGWCVGNQLCLIVVIHHYNHHARTYKGMTEEDQDDLINELKKVPPPPFFYVYK